MAERRSALWLQVVVVAMVGAGLGLAARQRIRLDDDWPLTHFRLDDDASYSLADGVPFTQQFFVDALGERVNVPLKRGWKLELNGATWWSVEGSGQMHAWDEERNEVYFSACDGEEFRLQHQRFLGGSPSST